MHRPFADTLEALLDQRTEAINELIAFQQKPTWLQAEFGGALEARINTLSRMIDEKCAEQREFV